MRYLGITTQESDDTLRAEFARLHGYPAEEVKRYWNNWEASEYRFVRIGPVYKTASKPAGEVSEGDTLLVNGLWHAVGLVDGPTVLTTDDTLLELPELVTVRL